MRRIGLSSLLLVMSGCVSEMGYEQDPVEDELEGKAEALLGASCETDAQCDAWEYCDQLLCIPERPCPQRGSCRDQTRFFDNESTEIPDGDAAGITRTIRVQRPDATVGSVVVDVMIDHTYRGDLEVVLRSPSGTELVLANREGGGADGLSISREVDAFAGQIAAGDWQLIVRDRARRDVGRLNGFGLAFTFVTAPVVDSSRAVWAEVALSGFESAHPYASRASQTWDLRPYTGSATRARVHFARLETEARYDFVEIVNAETGAVLDRFTGRYTDLTTREYETSALSIRLVSDASIQAFGFVADRVDVFGAGCLGDDDCGAGRACDPSIVCVRAPCFSQCIAAPVGDGAACRASSDCADDLYCATDGICRRDASCGATADCTADGNQWAHILCVGSAECTAEGACAWRCGPPPVCTDGETMYDGCNNCSCHGGGWACTKRYCPPSAEIGETCDANIRCVEGSECDRGPAVGASCEVDRPGICRSTEPVYCRAQYAPVCTCNGQTFPNECGRAGQGTWAHDGRCELSLAIPDADANGVRHTITVTGAPGATSAQVEVEIDHSFRGDLVVWIEAPDGSRHRLTDRQGGGADDFDYSGTIDLGAGSALGAWTVVATDRARRDVGVLRFFNVSAERPSPRVGQACGSRGHAPCAGGEFCQFEPTANCGRADAGGSCQLVPDACTREYAPVCGCDGNTYSNRCEAHARGVSVDYQGECR